VLTQRSDSVLRTSGKPGDQHLELRLTRFQYPLAAQQCSAAWASFYWGNQNDFDELDFYKQPVHGFAQPASPARTGSVATHKFLDHEGFGIYDTTRPELVCDTPQPCHKRLPTRNLGNAATATSTSWDQYATDGDHAAEQVKTRWTAACPPAGRDRNALQPELGELGRRPGGELDHSKPGEWCASAPGQVDTLTYDGL